MKEFDWLQSPLEGVNLIEAGAGTGKTYNIAGLYLRLVLEKGLLPPQILVVTFTLAATNQLRQRVAARLEHARRHLISGSDQELMRIAGRLQDPQGALQNLEEALSLMDQSAIFTIHGFCLRILQEFAFETGALFETELVSDQWEMVSGIAEDFWRRHIYRGLPELGGYILSGIDKMAPKAPSDLAKLWLSVPGPDVIIEPQMEAPSLDGLEPFRQALDQVVGAWPAARNQVLELLATDVLDGRHYGGHRAVSGSPSGRSKWLFRVEHYFRQLIAGTGCSFPVSNLIQQLGSDYIRQHTKKGKKAPRHPFFRDCQRLWDTCRVLEGQLGRYLLYLKTEFLRRVPVLMLEKKARLNVQFFDDLLLQVDQALAKKGGRLLVQSLRRRYKAALVDEFQDTDPVQCRIFTRLFSGTTAPLFMIGDPKQAIYGFRNADIFAYFQATGQAHRRYTLTCNWRSRDRMVEAVNSIFGNHPNPFVFKQIRYHRARAVNELGPDSKESTCPALTIWCLEGGQPEGKPLTREAATGMALEQTALEISGLLQGRNGRRCQPQDIAVLTRTNFQAMLAKQVLLDYGIPAALHCTGSVFDTAEAEQLFYVLAAISEPHNSYWVKAALATDLIRHPAAVQTITQDTGSPGGQDAWMEFHSLHGNWARHGFFPAFQQLLDTWQVRTRLLSQPDGLRRIANLIHLGELLHLAEAEHNLGFAGLVAWLADRITNGGGEQENQLRLEDDRGNVAILTAHRSKGLEFKIVFCPVLWAEPNMQIPEALLYHDPDRNWQPVLEMAPEKDSVAAAAAGRERLAENIRLIYVSLTRAKYKCYLVWGNISKAATSALAYLLHGAGLEEGDDDPKVLADRVKKMHSGQIVSDLKKLSHLSKGAIEVSQAAKHAGGILPGQGLQNQPRFACRSFGFKDFIPARVASFSSLVAQTSRDEFDRHWQEPSAELPGAEFGLNAFPKGTRSGLFFHQVLEQVDWSLGLDGQLDEIVEGELGRYGMQQGWKAAVVRMIRRLAGLRLPMTAAGFSLGKLRPGQWVNEMEFYFPLASIEPGSLRRVFAAHGRRVPDALFSRQMGRIDFSPVKGYLRGFVDMVFQHKDRFYLVDWKSNHLGSNPDDYGPDRLLQVMAQDYYFLQYSLYALALDLYLGKTVSCYSFERNFGGVLYIFLRGVALENVNGSGIFHIRPEKGLIRDLGRVITTRK